MCTIAVLHRVHPELPVIIAANRDELYARPARGPLLLSTDPRIAGGLDEVGGGTWLGLRADGAFVAVTNQNVGAMPDPRLRSRGAAVIEALRAPVPRDAIAALDPRAYNSGNFVVGDGERVAVAYLRAGPGTLAIEELPPGLHVITNNVGAHALHRAERVRALLDPHLSAPWDELLVHLHAALRDHQRPPDDEIPVPSDTPYPREFLLAIQQVCIHTPLYGTRSATVAALAPGRVVHYRYADGPSCTSPLIDSTHLLR